MSELRRCKRKGRRSLPYMIKKIAVNGSKKGYLEEEKFQYFIRAYETFKQASETKSTLVNNVLEEMVGSEVDCSSSQYVSRMVENMLPFANHATLVRFMTVFGSDLRPICVDRFASHVLQKVIDIASQRMMIGESVLVKEEEGINEVLLYRQWVFKVSKFLLNNLEEFVWHPYAVFIIRTVIAGLSGLPEDLSSRNGLAAAINNKLGISVDSPVPSQPFAELIQQFGNRLSAWPQFQDLAFSDRTSGLLQLLLTALRRVDKKQTMKTIRLLLDASFCPINASVLDEKEHCLIKTIPDVFSHPPAVRLLETAITLAASKTYMKLYNRCFVNRLSLLAKDRRTNFAVQKLINKCKDSTTFEVMYIELRDEFQTILSRGHKGVILSVCAACERLKTMQNNFIKDMMAALDSSSERQFVLAVIKMSPFTTITVESNELVVDLIGSLIVQRMLLFQKPIKIINGLLSMEPKELSGVLCSPKGSYIANALFNSEFVGIKSRERLFKKLQGSYVSLVTSKFGSFSMDAIWEAADLKHKTHIASELLQDESIVNNTIYGRKFASNIGLSSLRHNPDGWKQMISQKSVTKKLFASII